MLKMMRLGELNKLLTILQIMKHMQEMARDLSVSEEETQAFFNRLVTDLPATANEVFLADLLFNPF